MNPCDHPPVVGVEDELTLAEGAAATGDWPHALHHYLGALALDAQSAQAVAALRKLDARHDLLASLASQTFSGAHIARAWILADRGDRDQALEIAAQVDAAVPQCGAVGLLNAWSDQGPLLPSTRTWLLRRAAQVSEANTGRVRLLPGERAAIAPYAALAEKLAGGSDEVPLRMLVGALLRRAGRYDDALRETRPASPLADDPLLLVQTGLTERAAGRPDEAVATFQKAFERTGQPVHLLERARALAEAGRTDEALRGVADLSARGMPHSHELQLFVAWLEARARGDAQALARDYDHVRRCAIGDDIILELGEASTDALRDPRLARGQRIQSGVSCLEAPSARLCLAMHQGLGHDPRGVEYNFASVPSPDPRLPRGRVSLLLWRNEDGVTVQAVPPPPADLVALVRELASTPNSGFFDLWDAAGERAARVGGRLAELAATMVYPPDAGGFLPPWIQRCQLAAACLIARSETGWARSQRRSVLLDLLRGPGDWSTAAVALVLAEIAVREAEPMPEIRRELLALAAAIPTTGHCSYAPTLALVVRRVPLFPSDVMARLYAEWLAPQDGGNAGAA